MVPIHDSTLNNSTIVVEMKKGSPSFPGEEVLLHDKQSASFCVIFKILEPFS